MQTARPSPFAMGQAGLGRAGLSFNVRITTLVPNPPSADDQEPIMPISAYLQAAAFVILAGVALFAAAGTVAILTFWIYLAIFAVIMVAAFIWLDPGLLRERMRPGGKPAPPALRLFTLVMFLHWIVAGLDRGRFHWSDSVPGWLQAVAFVVFAAGYALCFWAMAVNRFFSSVVRIQNDRGHYVVTRGPYAFIRHPGYTAGILILLASGVALGSWLAAALIVVCSLPFLLHRAITEDRVLQADLPGYRAYAARVRWRLVPGLW
jgi:protein-S-isoprenylcysteine O-methyltransferase Ste14